MTQRVTRSHVWLLTSPVFALSIIVLVLNDHVLKHAWPGVVTGKVSDVAGVVMMAILATAVVRRPVVACTAVAVAFALLKTVPVVADLAIPVLGGRTATDPTDVVAIAALLPLARWMRRASADRAGSGGRHDAVGFRVMTVVAATLATSATSCYDPGVYAVSVDDGRAFAVGNEGEVFSSDDGGASWSADDTLPTVAPSATYDQPVCASSGVCFEIVDRGVVRIDGDRREDDYSVTSDEYDNLVGNLTDGCSFESSLFNHIALVQRPEGDHVIVSMGEYGVLHRDVSGEWSFVDVGDQSVGDALTRDPHEGRVSGQTFMLASVILAVLVLVGGVVLSIVSARRGQRGWTIAAQLVVGVLGAVGMLGWALAAFVIGNGARERGVSIVVLLVAVAAAVVCGAICALVQFLAPARPAPPT